MDEGDADESGDQARAAAQLLLTIAGAPETTRRLVETVATQEGVPLDALYGMLKALGVDTSDPSQLEAQLAGRRRAASRRLAKEHAGGRSDDARSELCAGARRSGRGRGRVRAQMLDLRERAVEAGRARRAEADEQKGCSLPRC